MTRHLTRLTTAAAAITLVTAAAVGSPANANATAIAGKPSRTHRVTVHAHVTDPPDVVTYAPPCTSTDPVPTTGVCRGTGFGAGTYTGGIQGTSSYEYGFVTDPAATTYFDILETFSATITGCGTGSITLRDIGTLDATGHLGYTWQVVPQLGSGQLANVTGHGKGQATYNADASQTGDISGQLRCSRP
jgi:hypothetical protein